MLALVLLVTYLAAVYGAYKIGVDAYPHCVKMISSIRAKRFH